MLRKVLKHRHDFEQDNFPPQDLNSSSRRLPAKILDDIRSLVNPSDFDRWIRFLTYWGGRPSSLEELGSLSARVPLAFGLDPVRLKLVSAQRFDQSGGKHSDVAQDRPPAKVQPTIPQASPVVERSTAEIQFDEHLERWRNGQPLAQLQAVQIRKLLADAVEQFITWDWDLFLPLEDASKFFESVYVPNAGGNAGNTQDGKSTMFALCTDEEARDPERNAAVALALLAVFRHRVVHKGSWEYAEADTDFPRYTAFIQSFVDATRSFVMVRYLRTPQDPTPAFVQGLMIGSKCLGIDGSVKGLDYAAIQAAMLSSEQHLQSQPAAMTVSSEKDPWGEFTLKLRSIRRKSDAGAGLSWVEHLLNLVGARQGGASGVYAIDASRLKAAIEKAHKTLAFDLMVPMGGSNENERFRNTYNELKAASKAVEKEADRLRAWRNEMIAWAGPDPDKEEMVQVFKKLIEHAKNASLAVGLEQAPLVKAVDEFREAAFKATFDDIARINESPQRIVILAVLGANHGVVMDVATGLRRRFDEFLAGVQSRLKTQSLQFSEDPKKEAVVALEHEVRLLLPIVREMSTL